jgi:hypothetical protein
MLGSNRLIPANDRLIGSGGSLRFFNHLDGGALGSLVQVCQMVMVYYQTKNPNFGKFRSVLQRNMLVNFMASWSISLPSGIFCGHLVYFVTILVYFSRFGMLYHEKSGSPGLVVECGCGHLHPWDHLVLLPLIRPKSTLPFKYKSSFENYIRTSDLTFH